MNFVTQKTPMPTNKLLAAMLGIVAFNILAGYVPEIADSGVPEVLLQVIFVAVFGWPVPDFEQ